ncbi:competence type IV pilus major pilin ComGC [Thalassobacillus sp. CUG 92003]|uniref:competence type IV pilus major pilin ComGC n=1 Tax=Thalassobacillus sp. CUG 92003 TaxID=2736641 RepID=UPI0015E795D4|nr:competence type IV pilus major pilin ComGC [Thalassobacillus sp. CUG 92003]
MKNEKGFTLIEMLIVLMIISVLLIITLPNLTANNQMINSKGCEALVELAEAQVHAYYLAEDTLPTDLSELKDANYLKQTTCPNGGELTYDSSTGEVSAPASPS